MTCLAAAASAVMAGACPAPSLAETLNEALAAAYRYNPQLDAERARLRATDEDVPIARSGYLPQINANSDINWQNTNVRPDCSDGPCSELTRFARSSQFEQGTRYPKGYSVDLTQNVFKGFQVFNAVNVAEANVRAERENLRNVEQKVLLDATTFFMDVVQDQAIVRLNESNVNVLSRELKATEDRFAVGEVTRTDMAQAQARRALSVAQLDRARADLKTSRGNFERVVGHAPSDLIEPSGYERLLPRTLDEAIAIGTKENPAVVAALYNEQAARYTVDQVRGQLLPEVQLEASYENRFDKSRITDESEVGTVTGRLKVPLYEGGAIYAQVRQAKQTHVSFLQEIEQARSKTESDIVEAWSQLMGFRAQLQSDQAQVEANRTALTGVREEERVGQRTLLDVLNAEQELVFSQVQLARDRRNIVVFSHTLLAAIGRLDVLNLDVTSTVYDAEAHYDEVRRKWIGLTTISHEDGRQERLDASQLVDHEPAK